MKILPLHDDKVKIDSKVYGDILQNAIIKKGEITLTKYFFLNNFAIDMNRTPFNVYLIKDSSVDMNKSENTLELDLLETNIEIDYLINSRIIDLTKDKYLFITGSSSLSYELYDSDKKTKSELTLKKDNIDKFVLGELFNYGITNDSIVNIEVSITQTEIILTKGKYSIGYDSINIVLKSKGYYYNIDINNMKISICDPSETIICLYVDNVSDNDVLIMLKLNTNGTKIDVLSVEKINKNNSYEPSKLGFVTENGYDNKNTLISLYTESNKYSFTVDKTINKIYLLFVE